MKTMKTWVLLFVLTISISSFAQNRNLKGFTAQTYIGMYMDGEELKSYDCDEVYSVSLNDGFLVHNILTDGKVSNAQMYKISNVKEVSGEDGEVTYSFNALSGLSGNIYSYSFSLSGEKVVTLTLIQPEGDVTVFLGTSEIFKTFKQ